MINYGKVFSTVDEIKNAEGPLLAGNGVTVMIVQGNEYTPLITSSHAILTQNRGRKTGFEEGNIITRSDCPIHDSGFKYNPPNGRPKGKGFVNG